MNSHGDRTARKKARLHIALLIASSLAVLWFSVAPSPDWKPAGDQSPVERILLMLLVTIGAPFFLLSATAPLLQSWFSRTRPERFPYRLYAVSNLGSLLAILSYPFLIEPSITRRLSIPCTLRRASTTARGSLPIRQEHVGW